MRIINYSSVPNCRGEGGRGWSNKCTRGKIIKISKNEGGRWVLFLGYSVIIIE